MNTFSALKKIPLLAVLLLIAAYSAAAQESTASFGRFGAVKTYQSSAHPKNVVLFISGDGGWNLGVVDMARSLAALDSLVVGIDITHYLNQLRASKEQCVYPASDFELLSKFIQKKFSFPQYVRPIIVGYSSGATLAYAIAAQAPPNTFAGAISLGFCSDMEVIKPFCTGRGLKESVLPKHDGWDFAPTSNLAAPWTVLHGDVDQVCSLAAAKKFVAATAHAQIVPLTKVGHGFSVQRNWMPQFTAAFKSMAAEQTKHPARPVAVEDLPIVEVPAEGAQQNAFAIIISGDGGWAGIDKEVADELAKKGYPVTGLSSLEYFWSEKSAQTITDDLARLIQFYSRLYHKQHVILIGYSLGAEVLPFMTAGLPSDLRKEVSLVALISAGTKAEFAFHLSDWISDGGTGAAIAPVVGKQSDLKFICIAGSDEDDSLCRQKDLKVAKSMIIPGGHHLGGDYAALTEKILGSL